MNRTAFAAFAACIMLIASHIGCEDKTITEPLERNPTQRTATGFKLYATTWSYLTLIWDRDPAMTYNVVCKQGETVVFDSTFTGKWPATWAEYFLIRGLQPDTDYSVTLTDENGLTATGSARTHIPLLPLYIQYDLADPTYLKVWVCDAWPGWRPEAAWVEYRQLPRGNWVKMQDITTWHPRCAEDAPYRFKPNIARGRYEIRLAGKPIGFPVQYNTLKQVDRQADAVYQVR